MLQHVDGKYGYVVDIKENPLNLVPVTGEGRIESLFAEVLTDAIMTLVITKPGKYLLYFEDPYDLSRYEVATITEE
jgi:hypothetical protein